jgi:hypothetical protein
MKKILILLFKKIMNRYWTNKENDTPKIELSNKHLKNAKIILSRDELIALMPPGGIVCELGVDEGNFSKKIIELNNPKILHLVDIWETKRYDTIKRESVEEKFVKQKNDGRVIIHKGYSTDVFTQFNDVYFDWIYIDTDHSYSTTSKELLLYSSKVKPGGFIAGHDFINGNWNGMVRYGVIEAVYEFCVNHNWEIVYLTMELVENPSFAIRKIS